MATPRSNIVKLRLTDLEKDDWQKTAGGARLLSEFIRRTVNAECARLRGEPIPADLHEEIVARGAKVVLAEEKTPLSTSGAIIPERGADGNRETKPATGGSVAGQCPRAHHHRPGRYCGTCKKVATKVGE